MLTLHSSELLDAVNRLSGEMAAVDEELSAQRNRRRDDDLNRREEEAAIARVRELEVKRAALQESLAVRTRELAALEVRSPVAGRVITWGVDENLLNRPLQRGQRLLEIDKEGGEWTTELLVNERRLPEVRRALRTAGRPIPVLLALANDHRSRTKGKLVALDSRAEASGDGSPRTVAARVRLRRGAS